MEDNQWQDPLLITDVSWQRVNHHNVSSKNLSIEHDISGGSLDPVVENLGCGRSIIGFSLSSPDLVVGAGSPEISTRNKVDFQLSEGIEVDNLAREYQKRWQSCKDNQVAEASFELLQMPKPEKGSACSPPVVSINVGAMTAGVNSGIEFSADMCFEGGDTIATDEIIGDGKPLSLYQTARSGNFSYHFNMLGPGNYLVSLHFAEIVFVNGPPGIRIFDVYLQGEKVVCGVDIYALVGANSPLVISDVKTFIDGAEGLSIIFEGVVGCATACGISISRDFHKGFGSNESLEFKAITEIPSYSCSGKIQIPEGDQKFEGDELEEIKKVLDDLRSEHALKKRECEVASDSLKELQNELMRKSMCVGSLAFAIEGQVKEKSKWFSSLRYLSRKVKILKMDHTQLAKEASEFKAVVIDITDEISSSIMSKLNQHMYQYNDLKIKLMESVKERRQLYNKVAELKGNIRVFCRSRPLNAEEIAAGCATAVDFESASEGEISVRQNGVLKKSFKFDAVFSPNAQQADVFEEAAPLAASVLDGFNVCIFAYGQTGTGKTFTMEGAEGARGVNFRTLERLFDTVKEREAEFRYDVSVSVLEVYNEQIRDLLAATGTQPGVVASKRLEIRQTGEGSSHHVPGIVEADVSNMKEVWQVLQTGSNARAVGSTSANDRSSRSHCIHCVMVKGHNLANGERTRSKLWLVDLAGSERIAKTEVQGERLKEAQNINKSLSALGDVISSLAARSSHIPFRNSKLTHLLQDSLGGDSKTLMLVQISPNEDDLSETLCSLNFASRVRGIELGPPKKQLENSELNKYKQMVDKIKQEMKVKDLQVKKMEDALSAAELNMKTKNRSLQEKVNELESQLFVSERRPAQQETLGGPRIWDRRVLSEHDGNKERHNPPPPVAGDNSGAICKPFLPLSRSAEEKENNRNDLAHPPPLPRRGGRASVCMMAHRVPAAAPSSRRKTMIIQGNDALTNPLLRLPPAATASQEKGVVEEAPWMRPGNGGGGHGRGSGKKISSILRRSMQKKVQLKSPLPTSSGRKGAAASEKMMRVSGRVAHRVLLGVRKQQNQMEKERGWNTLTTGKPTPL